MTVPIDILLATYNGEKYLDQQMASIIAQRDSDWNLIIRDDGSTDNTLQVLSKYIQAHPDKIRLLHDDFGRLGPSASFAKLLYASTAHHVAFCDQDDIWLPDKLLQLRQKMTESEDNYGTGVPVLVHSDLEVVDENADSLADSFWGYQNIDPSTMHSLERLLVQNCVTGCAMMVNRSLVDRALPIPHGAIMHDWWFALVAVSLGRIETIDVPLLRYRQHAGNDTGAKKWDIRFILTAMFQRKNQYRESVIKTRDQASALLESGRLGAEQVATVSRYVELFACNWIRRRLTIIRMGFYKHGLIRNIALMFWI